ncbi:phage integrase family protein [Paralcaligenes ureilyticus]|uniref:Phage integrase family protein n=1 Tax=Paralcaligenes ureilyticus TaxID=627131 RepID=A0A4R3M2S5_9BURK|nr:phage integrase family protein [Paralcaligenes ureilyticus]
MTRRRRGTTAGKRSASGIRFIQQLLSKYRGVLVFESTVVKARVYTDETGVFYEIPVLLTPNGSLGSLVDYFVAHWDIRSPQWMIKVVQAVRLFLEYLDAHSDGVDGQDTFQNFRQRLLTGSIDHTAGSDPSGLWWRPRGPKASNRIICNLTDFFSWWCSKHPTRPNPTALWRNSSYDYLVAQAAYEYRRNQAFLGHTWSSFQETSRKPGMPLSTKWHRTPAVEKENPPAFPEDRVMDLLFKGFKVAGKYNYRDMLITLLMNGAGFRVSEPFHLYLWDVTEDPKCPGSALILIHHPAWGAAPNDSRWNDATGVRRKGNRAEYLAEMYGLTPRDWALGTEGAGWKGGMHETQFGGYYKQAYWFIPEFAHLFWDIWHKYIEQVRQIDPASRAHPYAFMNVGRAPKGGIYKMGKFEVSHTAALERIGLVSSKRLGTSIHGHRHAYAQRLRRAGIPKEMIRRFMHHTDLASQEVYTQADQEECREYLAAAISRLNAMGDSSRTKFAVIDSESVGVMQGQAWNR